MRVERIGDATLYCGDCREFLPSFSPTIAIVTDPPYGMRNNTDMTRFSGGSNPNRRGKGIKRPPIHGDDKTFDATPFLTFKECILWGANHFPQTLEPGGMLIWIKRNDEALNTFLSDAEVAWVKGIQGVYAYREIFSGSTRALDAGLGPYDHTPHPNQKPVGLMRWALGYVKSQTVLDPFMGSGTTGVACARLGRKFTGIEIEPAYFETACRRIEREHQQGKLDLEVS